MPAFNRSVDPIASPADVMARFAKELLNEKNLSVIDEIAADDFRRARSGARAAARPGRPEGLP